MHLTLITVLLNLCLFIKKKNKILVYREKVNLINLNFFTALFCLYLNKVYFKNIKMLHTAKVKSFNNIKFVLIFFYIIFLLSKIKYNLFCFTNLFSSLLIIKKFFSKFFFLTKKIRFRFHPLRFKLIRYCLFYSSALIKKFFFIKYNIQFLNLMNARLFRLYNFFFIKMHRHKFKLKNSITKYCRNIINFKKVKQRKIFYTFKNCLLFFKKNILYTFKYKFPIYLAKLGYAYNGFWEIFLKKNVFFSSIMGVRYATNFLLSRFTFSNFLKSLDNLGFFYNNFFYNVYLKKIKYNFYITITNRNGDVISSNSSGKSGLLKKKQKKSLFAASLVVQPLVKILLRLNALSIKNFFCPLKLRRTFLRVKYFFLCSGITVRNTVVFNNKPHNFYYKKLKKQKRI